MPLVREIVDGVVNYRQDPLDPSKPVVLTGPVKGSVTTSDGTTYNVADDYIEVESQDHADEVAHLIGQRHATEGHPDHKDGTPFRYEPPAKYAKDAG